MLIAIEYALKAVRIRADRVGTIVKAVVLLSDGIALDSGIYKNLCASYRLTAVKAIHTKANVLLFFHVMISKENFFRRIFSRRSAI